MDPDTAPSVKMYTIREIHQLIKTDVLLLRDLPFVVNLSKYFDMSTLDPDGSALRNLAKSTTTLSLVINKFHTHIESAVLDNDNSNPVNTVLDKIKNKDNIF